MEDWIMAITEKTVLFKGSSETENIKILQKNLKDKGFYKYNIDGKFEIETDKSVKAFQKAQGLVVDGRAGPITNKKLGILKIASSSTASVTQKVLNLSYVEQPDMVTCGCVTGNQLLKNLGIDVTVERLRTLMKTKPMSATSPGTTPENFQLGIIAAAKEKGKNIKFIATNLENLKQIKTYIDKGLAMGLHGGTIPCMDYKKYYGHYITIIGYDTAKNKVCILDSSRGQKWVNYNCLKQFQERREAVDALKIIYL